MLVEVTDASCERSQPKAALQRRLKEVLGFRVAVTPVDRGSLDAYTGVSQTSKIKRLLDKRASLKRGNPAGLPLSRTATDQATGLATKP